MSKSDTLSMFWQGAGLAAALCLLGALCVAALFVFATRMCKQATAPASTWRAFLNAFAPAAWARRPSRHSWRWGADIASLWGCAVAAGGLLALCLPGAGPLGSSFSWFTVCACWVLGASCLGSALLSFLILAYPAGILARWAHPRDGAWLEPEISRRLHEGQVRADLRALGRASRKVGKTPAASRRGRL